MPINVNNPRVEKRMNPLDIREKSPRTGIAEIPPSTSVYDRRIDTANKAIAEARLVADQKKIGLAVALKRKMPTL